MQAGRMRWAITLLFAAGLVLAGAPVPSASASPPRPVKVMTRNLYLGADLSPAIAASSVPEVLAAGAHIFSVVQQTTSRSGP